MIIGPNISPLPFYVSIQLQNHRKDYAFGQIYPLIAHTKRLIPFQFILDSAQESLEYIQLVSLATGNKTDILQDLKENGLSEEHYSDKDISVISFSGMLYLDTPIAPGRYYLEVGTNLFGVIKQSYYSEVFTVCENTDNYLELEYSNSHDFTDENGAAQYIGGFTFRCYLDTQIGKPEYVFEEEATERMGYTFIESQISKKIYKFTFLAPEYLCDALRIVRLCDTKKILSQGQAYDLTTFSMEPRWEEQGDLAAVECEFETNTIIANIGGYK